MAATSVSVVVPLCDDRCAATEAIEAYLETTGFTFEVLSPQGNDFGTAVRRGVSDAGGGAIVIVDPALPYPMSAIGDAVAMVESGTTDVVFARTRAGRSAPAALRWLLVPDLPDPAILLMAFSSTAGKITLAESRLGGHGWELEVGFLANKYGFRVEHFRVDVIAQRRARTFSAVGGIVDAISIRLANRRNAYRAARRCPVCFSPEVWSCAQIPGNVVRACRRCKCRYLSQFTEDEGAPVRRVLRSHAPPAIPSFESHAPPARERTSVRRLRWVQRQLPSRARLLEVGVRDGSFGASASREYEYVGIDPAPAVARQARARGLDVYCASLSSFVNTGPSFDAITLFHVFENMPDPHDVLGRIKDLLKPGGVLFLSAFDTEGLIYLLTERRRMAQNFRTRLILYSRSALIELLERSGFEIIDIGPDFEYRDHKFVRHWLASHHSIIAPMARRLLGALPDPLIVSSGSIRIMAKRRSGPAANVRAIRSVEPTHAR